MSSVKVKFVVELPFWLCMDNGKYGIYIDGKPCQVNGEPWLIRLSNDKWLIEMGNILDEKSPMIAIVSTEDAKKIDKIFPKAKYHHKRKLRTVIQMGFSWKIKDDAKPKDAKDKLEKEWKWCTDSFIKSVNRFIDIYRTSNTIDKIPTSIGLYELSFNWWYTLYLDKKEIETLRLGLDAYPIVQKPPFKVKKETQLSIAEKLPSEYEPPSWKLIIENGATFHRRGNYRMAVIESYSGFELFMIDYLKNKYKEKELEQPLIDYLMNRTELNHMLNHGLYLTIGKKFNQINNELWSKWDNNKDGVRQLRHEIVHDGRIAVTKEESEKAINVINSMIKKLME